MTKKKEKILDKVKINNTIRAKCILKLLMTEKLIWKLSLAIKTILPKNYHTYTATMIFDEEPFEQEIASIERDIKTIQEDNQLFKDAKQKDIDFLKDRIEGVVEDRDKKKAECPTIEFYATTESLKYDGAFTNIVFHIGDTIISELNLRKNWFQYYRIELKPVETSLPQTDEKE